MTDEPRTSAQATPLRLAVVGAGAMGARHARTIAQQRGRFVLAAICDPIPTTNTLADQLGTRHFGQLDQLLAAGGVDGVVIATPNHLHAEQAIACLSKGVPVLIEKPVADTLQNARLVIDCQRRTGVPVLVGQHRRHNPLLQRARRAVQDGSLGQVTAVVAYSLRRKPDAYYTPEWRRKAGSGPLLINGIHEIDCMRYLAGNVHSVQAEISSKARGFEVEDTAGLTMRFESGALGTFMISDAVPSTWTWERTSHEEEGFPCEPSDTFLVCGTEASIGVPSLEVWRTDGTGMRGEQMIRTRLPYVAADPWLAELHHFGRVIQGLETPICDAADGAATLAVIEAAFASAQSGGRVLLSSLEA